MATTRSQAQIQADINYNAESIKKQSRCSKYGSTVPADYSLLSSINLDRRNPGISHYYITPNDFTVWCPECGARYDIQRNDAYGSFRLIKIPVDVNSDVSATLRAPKLLVISIACITLLVVISLL